jgi:hypothetical protein
MTNRQKASLLNSYFCAQSVIETPPEAVPPLRILTPTRLDNIIVSLADIHKYLTSLNVNKANGPDKISNKLLKETANSIAEPLKSLFEMSLASGKVPNIWKMANVTPVFKKGDRHLKSNYRPISLLSATGKILERVMFKSLYHYCCDNKLLTWRNSRFKQMDSAINQLIYISDKIYKSLEKRQDICMVYLDISKAFDRVWHFGLIYKLKQNGIRGNVLLWLSDYLSNRQQRVVINGQSSEWLPIKAGVPQGSILGPLLFLIYINDIVLDIKSDIFLFADGSTLMKVITDPIQSILELNDDLNQLNLWASQ